MCLADAAKEPVTGPPQSGWVRFSDLYRTGSHSLPDEERNRILHSLAQPLDTLPGEQQLQSMTLLQELAASLAYLFFPGCLIWVPASLGATLFLAVRAGAIALAIWVAVVGAIVLVPLKRWPGFLGPLIPTLFRYSSLTYGWEAPLPGGRPYLLICPPHGVLPVANLLVLLALRSATGFDFTGLTADAALRLPVMRQIMTWIGCQSATASRAQALLQEGHSLGISPGGVAEIFDVLNHDEVIFMRARKGFVKLALRSGAPLVPCYCFGNTKLFGTWYDSRGRMRALSRKLGFGLCPIWGRFYTPVPLIYRQPLLAVTGAPIEVPLEVEPTQASIDKYHALFLQELQSLFDRHKAAYGWGDRQLIIR